MRARDVDQLMKQITALINDPCSPFLVIEFQVGLPHIACNLLLCKPGASLFRFSQPFGAMLPVAQGLAARERLFYPGTQLRGPFLFHAEVVEWHVKDTKGQPGIRQLPVGNRLLLQSDCPEPACRNSRIGHKCHLQGFRQPQFCAHAG